MAIKALYGALVGAGFLLGTAGMKAVKSPAVKKAAVKGVAMGLQAKACYEGVIEQAKAQVDDIVAEAEYLNETKDAEQECACETAETQTEEAQ